MANKKNKLNKEQQKLVKKIMKENNSQRRVDKIVKRTRKAMDIYKQESQQAKVDKWVENTKKAMDIWNQEVNPQLQVDAIVKAVQICQQESQQARVDKWVAEELAKMAM